MVDISERSFEQVVEATLLPGAPDAYSGVEGVVFDPLEGYENAPGGYRRPAVCGLNLSSEILDRNGTCPSRLAAL